jgi:hypothetical protein
MRQMNCKHNAIILKLFARQPAKDASLYNSHLKPIFLFSGRLINIQNFCPTISSLRAQSLSAFSFPLAQDQLGFICEGLQFSRNAPLLPVLFC